MIWASFQLAGREQFASFYVSKKATFVSGFIVGQALCIMRNRLATQQKPYLPINIMRRILAIFILLIREIFAGYIKRTKYKS